MTTLALAQCGCSYCAWLRATPARIPTPIVRELSLDELTLEEQLQLTLQRLTHRAPRASQEPRP